MFDDVGALDLSGIGWVVISTETGKRKGKAESKPEWVFSICEQAKAQGVKVFMKEDLLGILAEVIGTGNVVTREIPDWCILQNEVYISHVIQNKTGNVSTLLFKRFVP